MNTKLLCTLGPASLNKNIISKLEELGTTLFRLNLSHTSIDDLSELIDFVQKNTNIPLSLDTEGAQIRNGKIVNGSIELFENETIEIVKDVILGNKKEFNLYPSFIFDEIELGNLISIDFNSLLVKVIKKTSDRITVKVINGGVMGQNKAVTINKTISLPPLTSKDIKAIDIGRKFGIKNYALSFANTAQDVDFIRKKTGKNSIIISKIECINGIKNLKNIINKSNAILIDRGDLSREIPIEYVPSFQNKIIEKANKLKKHVYVATNLLESMTSRSRPTCAEVNDVFNTLASGANGLVLAAETAIGLNPINSAKMIVKLVNVYEKDNERNSVLYSNQPLSKLLEKITFDE